MNESEPEKAETADKPDCFGRLDIVFPKGSDKLRHSPPACMGCVYKTECLRAAMEQPAAVEVESEKVDRAWESGVIGFFQRWSKKKQLHQKRRSHKD
ncbi:MAG TPA: hypothetical protein VKO20_01460 [Desulfosalsimonadaceae bacterium]|nr:hypothetical protein [Desulfosalsimonadaceae bacterium]